MSVKRVVLAERDDGTWLAVGPVYTDDGEEGIRDLIDGLNWTCRGTVELRSVQVMKATQP